MIHKSTCPPGTSLHAIKYVFLKPARLTIRNGEDHTVYGYGIGEQIEVLEPSMQYLVAGGVKLEQIPLADGRTIVQYPNDLCVQRVYAALD